MGEILTLQIGQCGNRVGHSFWETVCSEHKIDPSGTCYEETELGNSNVYFNEFQKNKFSPRSTLIDLESQTIDGLLSGKYREFYCHENVVTGTTGGGNNWGRGYFSEGKELLYPILDIIRSEAESCDTLHSVQILHSLGGGTGSGLGSLIVQNIREEYPDSVLLSFPIFPNCRRSESVTEVYNTMLSMPTLIDYCDEVIMFDNESLYEVTSSTMNLPKPNINESNVLVSKVISDMTSSMRFPGEVTTNLRKLATNMVPHTPLHFFAPSYGPLTSQKAINYRSYSIKDTLYQHFNLNALHFREYKFMVFLFQCNPTHGQYFSSSGFFRGNNLKCGEIETSLRKCQDRRSSYFMHFIPNIFSYSTSPRKRDNEESHHTATFLANSDAIRYNFSNLEESFKSMYKRKAYVHWYLNEGVESEKMDGLIQIIKDFQNEYSWYSKYEDEEQDDLSSEGEEDYIEEEEL